MSDGLTESYRTSRKETYLNKIELKKDQVFDQYKEYTKELLVKIGRLKYYSRCNKTFFGDDTIDYKKFDIVLVEIREIEIRIEELDKIIIQLDTEYQEAMERPLKSF